MFSDAAISADKLYRWWLFRCWAASLPLIIWIMMNPSTADHSKNDPTIFKIIRYSTRWGFGAALVINIYAYRTSKQENLPESMSHRSGPRNDWWIKFLFWYAARKKVPVVCAWGVKHEERGQQIRKFAKKAGIKLQCLEMGLNGEPKHPRFLAEDLNPQRLK
jgi:hypothetical protein